MTETIDYDNGDETRVLEESYNYHLNTEFEYERIIGGSTRSGHLNRSKNANLQQTTTRVKNPAGDSTPVEETKELQFTGDTSSDRFDDNGQGTTNENITNSELNIEGTWNPNGSVVLDTYSFHSDNTTTAVTAPPTSGLHTTVIVETTVDHTLNAGGTSFDNHMYSEKTDIVDYVQDPGPPSEYTSVLWNTTYTYQAAQASTNVAAPPMMLGYQGLQDAGEAGDPTLDAAQMYGGGYTTLPYNPNSPPPAQDTLPYDPRQPLDIVPASSGNSKTPPQAAAPTAEYQEPVDHSGHDHPEGPHDGTTCDCPCHDGEESSGISKNTKSKYDKTADYVGELDKNSDTVERKGKTKTLDEVNAYDEAHPDAKSKDWDKFFGVEKNVDTIDASPKGGAQTKGGATKDDEPTEVVPNIIQGANAIREERILTYFRLMYGEEAELLLEPIREPLLFSRR